MTAAAMMAAPKEMCQDCPVRQSGGSNDGGPAAPRDDQTRRIEGDLMSDTSQGPGWWIASDGKWYAPELAQSPPPPAPTAGLTQAPMPVTYEPSAQYAGAQGQYGGGQYAAPGATLPMKRCIGCGATVVGTAHVCTHCGTTLGTPKDKTVALLLAIFLAPWTWLYTYKRDSQKFWIGLVLYFIGIPASIFLIGVPFVLGVWIWAIVDTAQKSDLYYRQFPNLAK